MVAAFIIVGTVGAHQAERGARVFAFLDPLVARIRTSGAMLSDFFNTRPATVGWVASVTAAAIAAVGLLTGKRRAIALVLVAVAVTCTVWGQVFVLLDRIALGAALYGCGVLSSVALGAWWPLGRLDGFPEFPQPATGPGATAVQRSSRVVRLCGSPRECALVFGLMVVGLLSRTYALTELPAGFDGEMVWATLLSRTAHGLSEYVDWGFQSNTTGLVHLFVQFMTFHWLGTSVYSVRLAAVFWGVLSIPLTYSFVRRIAGVAPAVVATLLYIAAPEQLFWARSETTNFAAIAALALLTANLGLWMVERFSVGAVLSAALWMPFSRIFYAPGMIMFLFPLLLFGHAVIFARRMWRKALYVAPILGLGLVLWLLSLSIMHAIHRGHWQFVNAVQVAGAAPWTRQGQFSQADLPALIRLQVASVTHNLGVVFSAMTHSTGFTNWYQRVDVRGHQTLINVGLVVIVALGIGYLLGQPYDRRAALLLIWIALGLLPGVLSTDPDDRRIALVFPALYCLAGVMLAATVRLVRACAGPQPARLTTAILAVAIAAIAWMSLASHLLLPIGPTLIGRMVAFTRPLFDDSDVVFHDASVSWEMAIALGNADRLTASSPPCVRTVRPQEWLDLALDPRCDFSATAHRYTLAPERIGALRAAYRPQRITFLLMGTERDRRIRALLQGLFPEARWREFTGDNETVNLAAITVDRNAIQALHVPSLHVPREAQDVAKPDSGFLAGVRLAPVVAAEAGRAPQLAMQGGIALESDGWYTFSLAGACPEAAIAVDDHVVSSANEPLRAGIHRFQVTLPYPTSCPLPLHVQMHRYGDEGVIPVDARSLVTPAAAALPEAQAAPTATYAGYGSAEPIGPEGTTDFGVDAEGAVTVAQRTATTIRVQRLTPAGAVEASWETPIVSGHNFLEMAVAPDGLAALLFEGSIVLYDKAGTQKAVWTNPPPITASMALLPGGGALACAPGHNAVVLLSSAGVVEHEWNRFTGAPGTFRVPMSVTASAQGHVLVVEEGGEALLGRLSADESPPALLSRFRVEFSMLPVRPHGCALDAEARVFIPDPETGAPLVYSARGERLIATDPSRDLSRMFKGVRRFAVAGDRLYVLDTSQRLWKVAPDHVAD